MIETPSKCAQVRQLGLAKKPLNFPNESEKLAGRGWFILIRFSNKRCFLTIIDVFIFLFNRNPSK